jgi:hypothetical protein
LTRALDSGRLCQDPILAGVVISLYNESRFLVRNLILVFYLVDQSGIKDPYVGQVYIILVDDLEGSICNQTVDFRSA